MDVKGKLQSIKMPIVQGVPTVLEPPKDYVVDFDNPRRQGVPEAYYVSGFGMALSFLFIAQRLYVKFFLTGGVQVDDGERFLNPFLLYNLLLVRAVHLSVGALRVWVECLHRGESEMGSLRSAC